LLYSLGSEKLFARVYSFQPIGNWFEKESIQ
jgi:hypothetical protein